MMRFTFFVLCFWTLCYAQICIVYVPLNPLTSPGLATPYTLVGCSQATSGQSVFVEGVILDTTLGKLYVYNPLVITNGSEPLVIPTAPTLPSKNSVGLWFSTTANYVTLADNNNGVNLQSGNCVNGITGSIFGGFAYCNAVAFFQDANTAINSQILTIPPIGTAVDGLPCPTSRDFFIVDNEPSYGVLTSYISVGSKVAQDTTANRNNNPTYEIISSPSSSNRLLIISIYGAMGCTPFYATDLADSSDTVGLPALALNELQAFYQASPQALIPLVDPMTEVNNQPSLVKVNVYRVGVGQMQAANNTFADAINYCSNLYYQAPKRMLANEAVLYGAQSPEPSIASNLLAFMAQRFFGLFGPNGINCANLLNVAQPIVPTQNGQGIFTGATITVPVSPTTVTTHSNSERFNVNFFFVTVVVALILSIVK